MPPVPKLTFKRVCKNNDDYVRASLIGMDKQNNNKILSPPLQNLQLNSILKYVLDGEYHWVDMVLAFKQVVEQ
jgi:uncharacterized Fe-S cluster-containing radical SAM superfamily protein